MCRKRSVICTITQDLFTAILWRYTEGGVALKYGQSSVTTKFSPFQSAIKTASLKDNFV